MCSAAPAGPWEQKGRGISEKPARLRFPIHGRVGETTAEAALLPESGERQRRNTLPEVRVTCSGVKWRATADEDGHYFFAVAL